MSSASMELQDVLTFLGLVWVARWVLYIVLDVVAALRKFVLARLSNDNLPIKYGGKWAVVTGCTDGIGKEYARQLGQRGMNILLIARNKDKLNNVKQLIREEWPGVETEIVQVDFSHGRVIYQDIARYVEGKNIGILVNNVGMISVPPKKFMEISEDEAWGHINVNVASVVAMTQLVLPGMLARGRGAIINVASLASSYPMPYLGIYSATKAFVDFFSESLSWELRGSGITVQTLRPGAAVITHMTSYTEQMSKPSFFVATTKTYVTSALATLSHSGRTSGYLSHGLQGFLVDEIFNRRFYMYMIEWLVPSLIKAELKRVAEQAKKK